jgi:hypothetical protein
VKKKVKRASKPKKEVPKPASDEPTEKENLFDFGGLPQRDLKKNLGCG